MTKEKIEGKKKQLQTKLLQHCLQKKHFVFHNDLVKEISKEVGFGNPFDVTKIDSTEKLPELLKAKDFFILHLGEGKHQFVKGIKNGYHKFETIPEKNIQNWTYRKSLLNEYDTSESNILSVAFNQRITHHFLYGNENIEAKVYQSRRTKKTISYNVGKQKIKTTNLQMEIDQTFEHNGVVTVVEGKNGFLGDFAVYQIYIPFVYFSDLKKEEGLEMKQINCCYLLRDNVENESVLRLYLYSFKKPGDMTSIQLLKAAEYKLVNK